jgi:hypothetical protein
MIEWEDTLELGNLDVAVLETIAVAQAGTGMWYKSLRAS